MDFCFRVALCGNQGYVMEINMENEILLKLDTLLLLTKELKDRIIKLEQLNTPETTLPLYPFEVNPMHEFDKFSILYNGPDPTTIQAK
jgi:hypothetical protein